jgi:LEA14-like dessication related protein
MGKKWLIFPALFIGYYLYEKFVLTRTFSVYFKNLDFSRMSLLDPTINLVLQVNNPTTVTATIQQMQGILYIDGQAVGSVLGINPSVLQTGSSTLNVPVTLNYDQVGKLITRLKDTKFSYRFNGTIMVDYINIPLNFGYNS